MRHLTQWAAQFAVASELCKKGYDVGFTMGQNTPLADLLIIAPETEITFLIDVKGQSTKNFWQIRRKRERKDLFYILCFVPKSGNNRFFIMSQNIIYEKMTEYEFSGVKFDPRFSGVNWTTPHEFENRWDLLPR